MDGKVIKFEDENRRYTTFFGTPKEIVYVVSEFFEHQRRYEEEHTSDESNEVREAWRDALERELWEIKIAPLNRRAFMQVRPELRSEIDD